MQQLRKKNPNAVLMSKVETVIVAPKWYIAAIADLLQLPVDAICWNFGKYLSYAQQNMYK